MTNNHSKVKSRRSLFLIILIGAALIWGLLIFYGDNSGPENPAWEEAADLIRQEAPQGLFLSTYPDDNFYEEDFTAYRSLKIINYAETFHSTKELAGFLKYTLRQAPSLEVIYLGLDPLVMDAVSDIHRLTSLMKANFRMNFEILLPAPPQSYWNSLEEAQRQEAYDKYLNMISALSECNNVLTYFMGAREWLVSNQYNYVNQTTYNDQVALTIMLSTFCDQRYQVTEENAADELGELEQVRLQALEDTTAYQDGENWAVVFLGDSMIGNYTGSLSVPGVVHNFTGAEVFNCGFGGTNASAGPESNISLPVIADALLTGELSALPQDSQAYKGLQEYASRKDSLKEKNLFIVINYGLNDYLKGHPVSGEDKYDIYTYEGAVRSSVEKLKRELPEAEILLMAPTYCTYNSYGTQKIGDYGGVLTDYVAAILRVSRELSVPCINNYKVLGTDLEDPEIYLADGCHLNEMGRYVMGINIGKALGSFGAALN